MRIVFRRLALLLVVLGVAGCASAAKLAKQSSEALADGDLRKAYDRALSAIEKDPQSQAARSAYDAASKRLDADYHARVIARSAADTLGAADLALEAQRFRQEVARHETMLVPAPDYERTEQTILSGAAGIHYKRGADAMNTSRPKRAVSEFTTSMRYDANYRDVASRLDGARRAATAIVALLPFADNAGVPGLSQEMGDTVQIEIGRRAPNEFHFTEIVPGAELERKMTVAELRNPRIEDAVRLGRRIGADRVVVGRFRSLRSTNNQRSAALPLYHRVEDKDDKGVVTVRWEEGTLQSTTRDRGVTVQYEFDVVDVKSGAVLLHREQPARANARIVWTDFRPEARYDRYALLPPDVRRADPERAKRADADWREQFGSWDLDDLLKQAREQRTRQRYIARYRGEFYRDTRERPVWLGELPGEDDLAFVALHDMWRTVLAALKELDERE